MLCREMFSCQFPRVHDTCCSESSVYGAGCATAFRVCTIGNPFICAKQQHLFLRFLGTLPSQARGWAERCMRYARLGMWPVRRCRCTSSLWVCRDLGMLLGSDELASCCVQGVRTLLLGALCLIRIDQWFC